MPITSKIQSIGLFGYGPFGRLIACHLAPHFPLIIHDPNPVNNIALPPCAQFGQLNTAAACDLVILAMPVCQIAPCAIEIAPYLRPGCIVVDVGSVKMIPAQAMIRHLPQHVDLVGTHPLFGPQSSGPSLAGRKIAICNIRGRAHLRLAAFLRRVLNLKVYQISPEDHDREAAISQGLTHLIAKVLVQMEPLPVRMTTVSFDLLMQAIEMVRHDQPRVVSAIERDNPFAAEVRQEFLSLANSLAASSRPP